MRAQNAGDDPAIEKKQAVLPHAHQAPAASVIGDPAGAERPAESRNPAAERISSPIGGKRRRLALESGVGRVGGAQQCPRLPGHGFEVRKWQFSVSHRQGPY